MPKKTHKYFIFVIITFSLIVFSTRLATLLHECIGHAVPIWMADGSISKIYISTFGGGVVFQKYSLLSSPLILRLLISWGGLIVNLITGIFGFFLYKKIKGSRPFYAYILLLFAGASVIGCLQYVTLGSFHLQEDPVSWTITNKELEIAGSLWPGFLVLLTVCSFYYLYEYKMFLDNFFSSFNLFKRLFQLFITLGIPIIIYGFLFFDSNQKLAAIETYKEDVTVSINKAKAKKYIAVLNELKEIIKKGEQVPATINDVPIKNNTLPPISEIPVDKTEVDYPFPLILIIGLIYCLAGITSCFFKPKSYPSIKTFSLKNTLTSLFLATLALFIILSFFSPLQL